MGLGQYHKTYTAIDPRLSLRYLLTDKLALQASYSLMQQYVHLLSSNSVILQTDLWVPVTGKIKPMQSSKYLAGVFYELSKSVFFSFEAYYKDMRNVIEYKDGVSYTSVSAGWENKVEAGTGRACGMELSVEKREGRITGTASYTLSKSERRVENINFGEWFPAKYDRRHALNLLLNYRMNARFDFTAAWTYLMHPSIQEPNNIWSLKMDQSRNTHLIGKIISESTFAGAGHRPVGRYFFRACKNIYQYAGRIWHFRHL